MRKAQELLKHGVEQVKHIISLQDFSEPLYANSYHTLDDLGLSGVPDGPGLPSYIGVSE